MTQLKGSVANFGVVGSWHAVGELITVTTQGNIEKKVLDVVLQNLRVACR